jgi:hypothetical protein
LNFYFIADAENTEYEAPNHKTHEPHKMQFNKECRINRKSSKKKELVSIRKLRMRQ